MGTAMAMWGDSLLIAEVVDTGKVEIVFQNPQGFLEEEFCQEDLDNLAWGIPDYGGEYCAPYDDSYSCGEPLLYEKDKVIGFAVMQIDRMDEIEISFSIKNTGTIPVKINQVLNPDILQDADSTQVITVKRFSMDKWEMEPGETADGSIVLEGEKNHWWNSRYCIIPIEVIQWNGSFSDSLPWWKDTLYIRGTLNG